ncbi:SIS domain-containing protein, partial [Klebsiella pneumoniae]|uniref:SIS domain-containing protein n=1 Tax=Klebsiella pneumoniae TaxID=573 RepID=UPI002108C2C1
PIVSSPLSGVSTPAMSSDDLLLAISYSGERREINMAAGEALRVGCKILAITGFSPNALQQQATHCLYTIAEEQATAATSSVDRYFNLFITGRSPG